MSNTVQTAASLTLTVGSRITLAHEERPAVIRSILQGPGGVQYEVSYWREGVRYAIWVHRDEFYEA